MSRRLVRLPSAHRAAPPGRHGRWHLLDSSRHGGATFVFAWRRFPPECLRAEPRFANASCRGGCCAPASPPTSPARRPRFQLGQVVFVQAKRQRTTLATCHSSLLEKSEVVCSTRTTRADHNPRRLPPIANSPAPRGVIRSSSACSRSSRLAKRSSMTMSSDSVAVSLTEAYCSETRCSPRPWLRVSTLPSGPDWGISQA